MTRRRRRQLLAAAVALGIVAVVLWQAWPTPFADRLARIQPGVTRAEVTALLGARPNQHMLLHASQVPAGYLEPGTEVDLWSVDEGWVMVWFDPAGGAERVRFEPNPYPPSLFDKLRSQLPW